MDLTICTLAERSELAGPMWAMASSWPEFMRHDPISDLYYGNVETRYADHVLVALDEDGEVVARAHTMPFVRPDGDLPADGWDFVVLSGTQALLDGTTPDAVSAIEIVVRPDRQGQGLSSRMLAAMRDNARRLGFDELVAPVRPTGKADVHQPMADHAFAVRDDGLPVDPWLRVHVRAGGVIDRVAERAMAIPGTLEQWRSWTGLPFDTAGPVEVPGALAPVHVDLEQGTAVYVEPNVWVRHRTA